jgi:hypothetical protein
MLKRYQHELPPSKAAQEEGQHVEKNMDETVE